MTRPAPLSPVPLSPRRTRRLGLVLAGVAAAALAGCGSQFQDSNLMKTVGKNAYNQILDAMGLNEPGAPPRQLTRAEINQIPVATIGAYLPGDPTAYFVADAVNNGRVTYINPTRQSLVMQGGALSATHGLGDQRIGYVSDPEEDFLVRQRPVAEWPAQVTRIYRFLDGEYQPFSRTFLCAPKPVAQGEITIAQVKFPVIEVEETCRSPYREITNRYYADAPTGYVWRSDQWVGPDVGMLRIDILKPYSG